MRTIRLILHVDMDAFFASCEQKENKELRGKAIAVGGSPSGRGVVAAASYEARAFGVRSAMPAAKAKALCPHLIFVPPNFRLYQSLSRQIFKVFREVTPLVEPLSIDEAFLDVSYNWLRESDPIKVARYIVKRIRQETQLSASVGIGPNKLIAKIASGLNKPNGLVEVSPESVLDFLAPLSVQKLWGVGPATAKRLSEIGILTIGEIRTYSAVELERKFGKFGPYLLRLSKGLDTRPVSTARIRKSVGSENTFSRDLVSLPEIEAKIDSILESVVTYTQNRMLHPRRITLKVRYDDFHTITRSKTRDVASIDFAIWKKVILDLCKQTEIGSRPLRLLGISFSEFSEKSAQTQLDLPFSP